MKQDAGMVLNVAAKAVVANSQGQILILRESSKHATNTNAGRYQLPGGRLELGEPFFDGLQREIVEETGLKITVGAPLLVGEWRPVVQGVPHQIIGLFLAANTDDDRVTMSEEHDDYLWIDPAKRRNYDIMVPDDAAIDAYATAARQAE